MRQCRCMLCRHRGKMISDATAVSMSAKKDHNPLLLVVTSCMGMLWTRMLGTVEKADSTRVQEIGVRHHGTQQTVHSHVRVHALHHVMRFDTPRGPHPFVLMINVHTAQSVVPAPESIFRAPNERATVGTHSACQILAAGVASMFCFRKCLHFHAGP